MSFEFSQNSDDVTLTDNHGAMSTGDGENPDKDDNLSAQIKSLVRSYYPLGFLDPISFAYC
ncbi:hypothetical protein Pst134EA_000705 [Puccinia striiformis f. sp. tritici]|uniref:hypothetical protein n=1 Tax=Puccinia striiformis f. sp. tritici TaxID=168172 RepID=UPI002008A8DF|nr:hypothetical protein Pst134EA_000705 [Puccinia striiformis f. sp. tritici]KAH9473623.1 hypothetical protein Pst134EA_000705 [Puccinia striiformis f. sp. tritici]